MYACDYLENGVLNVLRGVTFTAPAKVYLALYLNDPGEDGASGTEVSYAGYKRVEIDFSAPADTNGGIGVQNITDLTFPNPVAAAGTITHIGIVDSLTGGNMLCRGELTEPLVIGADEPPVFLAGDVLFYLTGNLSKAWKSKVLNILRGQSIQGKVNRNDRPYGGFCVPRHYGENRPGLYDRIRGRDRVLFRDAVAENPGRRR